jgi:hypothetical protein
MDWIVLAQDKGHWRFLVNTVMNLQAPLNTGRTLSGCFLKRASLSGVGYGFYCLHCRLL